MPVLPTRIWLAFLALLSAAASATAQTAPANVVTPAPPPREGTVGPEQLRDFALPGTRTTPAPPAEPVPAPAPTRERAQPARPAPQAEQTPAPRTEPPRVRDVPATERGGGKVTPASGRELAAQPVAPPAEQIAVGLGPATIPPVLPASPLPQPAEVVPERTVGGSSPLSSWWAWLIVAALIGIALALVLRQRGRRDQPALAGHDLDRAPPPSPPAPAPQRRASAEPRGPATAPPAEQPPLPSGLVTTPLRSASPPPRPSTAPSDLPAGLVSSRLRPSSPAPLPDLPTGAVVSTRLRPTIELDIQVTDVVLTERDALLRFRLGLDNVGSAGARDLVIEALALNAGEGQDAELASFFERPDGTQVAIPELARMGSAELTHEVRMPRAAIHAYEVQGRRVFVPILAFNVGYRWATGTGRSSAAFLLGHRQPGSERLAPLGLEEGDRRLASPGVRRLENAARR